MEENIKFTDYFKKNLDKKHLDMLDGKTVYALNVPDVLPFEKFAENFEQYHDRLADEAQTINNNIKLCKDAHSARARKEKQRERQRQNEIAIRKAEEEQRERQRQNEIDLRKAEEKQRERAKKERISNIITAIVVIVVIAALIIGIVVGVNSCNAKKERNAAEKERVAAEKARMYSEENISVSPTEKSSTYGGYTYSHATIKFTISNSSSVLIRDFKGEMMFYDGGLQIGGWTITCNQSIPANGSEDVLFEFTSVPNTNALKLDEVSFTSLKITLRITSATWDDLSMEYNDSQTKTIKNSGVNASGETMTIVDIPAFGNLNLTYNAGMQTLYVPTSLYYTVSGNTGTNVGTYTATLTLVDSTRYEWRGYTTRSLILEWYIVKQQISVPTVSTTYLVFNGQEQTLDVPTSPHYTISGNVGITMGSYTATLTLNDTANYEWAENGYDYYGEPIREKYFWWYITNNSSSSPAPLSLGSTAEFITDTSGIWYSFTLDTATDIRFTITGSANIAIYSSENLSSSLVLFYGSYCAKGGNPYLFSAGTYYIKIYSSASGSILAEAA